MKKIYRSRKDRMIFGVCGGLSEYFEVDSSLIRIIVVLSMFLGITVFAYFIIAIILPEESKNQYCNCNCNCNCGNCDCGNTIEYK